MPRTPPPPGGSHRPPRAGQAIRAPFLRQEYTTLRRAVSPDGTTPGRWFYAPGAGIGAPTVDGLEVTPAQAICTPARWTGEAWVPDDESKEQPVFNSWPGETVPPYALIWAVWAWDDHYEVSPFSCTGLGG